MGAARKFDLDRRLEAYFATLDSHSLKQTLKRSAANWQIYATVTGSAIAMVANASAAMVGSGVPDSAADPTESAQTARQLFASSKNPPLVNAIRRSMADAKIPRASQAQAQPPTISPGGVVPLYGTVGIIQPGEWISIYGANLAAGPASWNGDFPTSLGGTSVEINGKPGYLEFVSPGLINLQAPDDTATGTVSVVVTTAGGKATSAVTLAPYSPSFSLLNAKYVAGIILRSNGKGAYGGGSYDILGPTGTSFGYPTVAAKAGDTVVLYSVGFGPTMPAVPAGQPFSGSAPVEDAVNLYINNMQVKPTFIGLSSAGLYQINLKLPSGLGQGDVAIKAVLGSAQTQAGVLFPLRTAVAGGGTGTGGTGGGGGGGGTGFGSSFGTGSGGGGTGGGGGGGGGGTGGGGGGSGGGTGGGGGSGGGGSVAPPPGTKPYHPRLRFTREG